MRIVSLLPSATEIVCALGLSDALVGVSHDCDHPPEIFGKPVLSEAVVTTDMPSGRIDAVIRERVHRGRSVYHLDAAQLAALRPDLILTQELCTVCAPSYTMVTEAAKVLDADTTIVSLEPLGLFDILETIRLVGHRTRRSARAEALVAELRARIDRVRERTTSLPRPRVVCIEWLEPIYVAGHWIPEMVELAGGQDVLGRPREPSFAVPWERVVAAQPEVVVVMPCGFDVPRTREEIHLLTRRPGWRDLPAFCSGRVYLTEATSYFSRPGPRIVTGLEILAGILHPEEFAQVTAPGAVETL
ncbi:MAG: cobalamin-binding protein [Armatimonadota bacterium]|nr:cobalamin-binding protein [Armatimonadota bacterium]MDR5696125.1 cobalamin-binding protein [Armatimonadota bacterium]